MRWWLSHTRHHGAEGSWSTCSVTALLQALYSSQEKAEMPSSNHAPGNFVCHVPKFNITLEVSHMPGEGLTLMADTLNNWHLL